MDYISREAVYDFLTEQIDKETGAYSKGRNAGLNIARSALHNKQIFPAADVREVVKGEWIPVTEQMYSKRNGYEDVITEYECSVCGRKERFMEPFCNCGAMMGGQDNAPSDV